MTLPNLDALLRSLREGDVEFVVVGGVAVAAHEYVRATEDLDIVPAPDHDHLVAMKRARGQPIDIADLERLTDAQG